MYVCMYIYIYIVHLYVLCEMYFQKSLSWELIYMNPYLPPLPPLLSPPLSSLSSHFILSLSPFLRMSFEAVRATLEDITNEFHKVESNVRYTLCNANM